MVGPLLIVPVLIALNAFFVAGEYAVVAAKQSHLELLRKRFPAVARALERLKANPASAIGTIQVCITMTNLLLGSIGEPAITALLELIMKPVVEAYPTIMPRVSLIISYIIVTLLTVVFSELLPKALTLRFVYPVAIMTSVPIIFVQTALGPVVWIMNTMPNLVIRPLGLGSVDQLEDTRVTSDELRFMATQAASDGVVTPRERSLILNSLAIGRRAAREIMVPRVHVRFLDLQKSMDENRGVINEYLYSRLPLCDGGMDKVVGVVPTKEFLSAYNEQGDVRVLSLIAQPAVFAPEMISLDRLLGLLHESSTQICFVVDEYGGVEGIVTLRDVIDELLGDVATIDPLSGQEVEAITEIIVPGDMPMGDFRRKLGSPEWGLHYTSVTIGGSVVSALNRIPRKGEELTLDGLQLKVLETTGRSITRLQVERVPIETGILPAPILPPQA